MAGVLGLAGLRVGLRAADVTPPVWCGALLGAALALACLPLLNTLGYDYVRYAMKGVIRSEEMTPYEEAQAGLRDPADPAAVPPPPVDYFDYFRSIAFRQDNFGGGTYPFDAFVVLLGAGLGGWLLRGP